MVLRCSLVHILLLAAQKACVSAGAVMRTSVLGILNYDNIDKVIANTIRIAKVVASAPFALGVLSSRAPWQVTHFDSRCVASCVAVTTAIAMMLQGHDVSSEQGLQSLIEKAVDYGLQVSHSASLPSSRV